MCRGRPVEGETAGEGVGKLRVEGGLTVLRHSLSLPLGHLFLGESNLPQSSCLVMPFIFSIFTISLRFEKYGVEMWGLACGSAHGIFTKAWVVARNTGVLCIPHSVSVLYVDNARTQTFPSLTARSSHT